MNLDAREVPEDTDKKQEIQDGREVKKPQEKMYINIHELI